MISPSAVSPAIILSTLNAKFIHASLGLRYLLANMGALRPYTVLSEFTVSHQPSDVVAALLASLDQQKTVPCVRGSVQIVGFGVYIWNVVQTTAVVRLLKAARSDIKVVLGGPEVSHEFEEREIVHLADHVVTGWGDLSFARLCQYLCDGITNIPKVIVGEQPPLKHIVLPYMAYSDADLAHRLLYVEASRGCPFKCEFCLSSLDKTAWAFDLELFLAEMQLLYQRGARHFKFVDRTFNLKIESAVRILQFFLDLLEDAETTGNLFVHFEVVPDHLPERLKAMIALFPPGVLQFEVGVQTFNVEVQQRISRRQDNDKTETNIRWLVNESNAHLHTDLLFGLPGETLESFAAGFDRLYALKPHEIQMGILKRLRGTPIIRHTLEYGMDYDPDPPYSVRQTSTIDAATMLRFVRFARYWDLIANSGRFRQTLLLMMENARFPAITSDFEEKAEVKSSPFYIFMDFSDWFWARCGKTNGLSPEMLVDALFDYLGVRQGLKVETVRQTLLEDYLGSGARGSPQALKGFLPRRPPVSKANALFRRQGRHLDA